MLKTLGYVVEDSEGRYLAYTKHDGYMYRRVYQVPPHVFERMDDAEQCCRVFSASGAAVKPVYIELVEAPSA
jgi:hypothetical protein